MPLIVAASTNRITITIRFIPTSYMRARGAAPDSHREIACRDGLSCSHSARLPKLTATRM